MTAQHIKIDELGRVVGAYKDDHPVDLGQLGAQRIERFSEVLHSEEWQRFYVVFKDAAPEGYRGQPLNTSLAQAAGHPYAQEDRRNIGLEGFLTFPTYGAAVAAEQAVLHWMMKTGEM